MICSKLTFKIYRALCSIIGLLQGGKNFNFPVANWAEWPHGF